MQEKHIFFSLILTKAELLALTWEDLDFKEKTITINKNAVVVKYKEGNYFHYKLTNQESTKTKSGNRVIPMSEMTIKALQELKKLMEIKNM